MAGKFLVIDGNSLLYRAYHALPPLTASNGQPTGALLGFAEMLLNLLDQEQPAAAAVAFDAPGPTFRHEQYADYKAHRPPMPEDLVEQLRLARDLVAAMGMRVFEVAGVEADDVIATLAGRAAEEGYEVLAVSGDRDLVQIVGPKVRVLATVRGFSDTHIYDEAAVREEYAVEPARVAELKGLQGDSSDNIPGVPGVGAKTARRLLGKYGSLEAVYEHLDDVKPERIAGLLREHRDQAEMSTRLATVERDVPLEAGPEECVWQGYDAAELRGLFSELEFGKLLPRVAEDDPEEMGDLAVAKRAEDVAALLGKAGGSVGFAVAALKGKAVGVALAAGSRALYVPLGAGEEEQGLFADPAAGQLREAAAAVLADSDLRKTAVDAKADMEALEAADLELAGVDFDVSVAAYLTTPQRGDRALEALALRYLGWQLPAAEVTDAESAAEGVGRRALALGELRELLERELEHTGMAELYRQVEVPLIPILRGMERAGIAVDRARLAALGEELTGLTDDLAARIHALAGHEFNVDSPKQLEKVLFEELGLPKLARTKTGYSTSADVLSKLADEHEIPRLVMEYREHAKLRSTYVDGLLRLADAGGRVHTTFEQTVVATGRLSSRNPNLQNIPVRTEEGRRIRACFVAPAADWALVSADYSQIELRILAHLSDDPQLIGAFERDEDVHTRTAALIFDVPAEQVDGDMRRAAKTVNYAVLYGMGPASLAQSIGVKRDEAERFIEHYFKQMPGVRGYMDRTLEQARQRLWVETLFGRRRPVPELAARENRTRAYAERAAVNAPIQGTAADIMKRAMVALAEKLPAACPRARLLLQVHDELVLEAPEEDVPALSKLLKEVMAGAAELRVPLKTDVKAGPNWRDMDEV